ncbi:MAG: hypothetical protein H6Q14_2444 [Bacteroidetes bacterium]|nr:hypothetical protein [Bacteroidota bacterium]
MSYSQKIDRMFNKIKNSFQNNINEISSDFSLQIFSLIEYYKDKDTFMAKFINTKEKRYTLLIFMHMDLLTLNIEKTIFNYSIYKDEESIISNRINYFELRGKDIDENFKNLFIKINNNLSENLILKNK